MARFTQDRMYEMLGEISKKQKPIYKTGGLKEADCPFGYSLVNGKCVPDPDCEDGQCRETDEIQAIYDKADSIPNRVVDFERGVVERTNRTGTDTQYSDARKIWREEGIKSFVEPSCMYIAGLGYRCAPETEDYFKKFNPVHFNSNIGFIHAVDRGDVPFKRTGKFSDRNFDALEKGNVQVGDIVNFKGADNSHAMTFIGYTGDGHPKYVDSNGSPADYGIHGAWPDLRPNDKGKGKDYAYVNRFDTERYVDDTYGKQVTELEKQARENPTFYKQGGLTQYPGGGGWPPLKRSSVYVNPLYMGNFVGGNNSFETLTGENSKYDVYNPYSASSFNAGIQIPLSKNRKIDSEKTKGWMMDAYVGMPYSQMIGEGAKFLPSAGVKFDFENSPQNDQTLGFRKFRPFVNVGAEYSPTDGFGVGVFGGGRTPFGKKIVPGYGAGHVDVYGGFQGGVNPGKNKSQLSPIIGGRIKGEYEPNRKSFLNKVLGDDVSIFGEAGATANFFKGKMTQRDRDDVAVIATGNDTDPGYGTAAMDIRSQPDTVGVGFDFYANVGLKKKLSDFKSTKKKSSDNRIQQKQEDEQRAFQENEIEKEEPVVEKLKKECPEGETRYCENCPCEPIEKHKHPRWLRDGGLIQYGPGGDTCPDDYIKDENGNCVWHDVAQENNALDKSAIHPIEYSRSQLTMGDPFYNTHGVVLNNEGKTNWENVDTDNTKYNLRNTDLRKFIQRDPNEGPGVESGYLHNNIWTSPTLGLEKDPTDPGYAPNQLRYERDSQHPNVYFIKNSIKDSKKAPSGSYTRGWRGFQNKNLNGSEYNKAQNEVGQNLLKQGYKGENMWGASDEDQLYQLYGTEGSTLKGATEITSETLKYLESIKDSEEGKRYLAKLAGISEDDPDYADMLMHYNTTPIDVYADSSRPKHEDLIRLKDDVEEQSNMLRNTEGPVAYQRGGQYAEGGEHKCPDGYTYNSETGYCEKAGDKCPPGYEKDPDTGRCRVMLKACSSSKSTDKKYKYTDCLPDRAIPKFDDLELELEKPGLEDYDFPKGEYYPDKKKYLDWQLKQRYDTQPLVKVREKNIIRKEDPLLRFVTGYDRAKKNSRLYKEHKEWGDRFKKELGKLDSNPEDIEFPSFRGIPVASWQDLKDRRQYKKDYKDYIKNELPSLIERNKEAKAAYEQELIERDLLRQEEEDIRNKAGADPNSIIKWKYGGILNRYAEGGEPCPDGYIKNQDGNCISQEEYNEQLAQQQVDEAKDFTSKYFESPMYNQMLQASAGDDYQRIKEGRDKNLKNIPDVNYQNKTLVKPWFANAKSAAIGYSNAANGQITLGQDGLTNKGVAVHEFSHSTETPFNFFDKIFSPQTKRLIPESDKELIEGMANKDFHKTPYFQENRNRIMNFGPEGFHEEKKAYDDFYKNYVGLPTETRARLMEIRKAASDAYQKDPNAMYDPFNQKVTPETYQKLLKYDYEPAKDDNRKWEKKFTTPLEELKSIYTDEEIMKLLNTVAKNESQNDDTSRTQSARFGGQSNFEKVTLLNKFFRQ